MEGHYFILSPAETAGLSSNWSRLINPSVNLSQFLKCHYTLPIITLSEHFFAEVSRSNSRLFKDFLTVFNMIYWNAF